MSDKIIHGTALEANQSERMGWVVGGFFPRESLQHDRGHEVKLWRYDVNPQYGVKGFPGTELIVIYGGRIRVHVFLKDSTEYEFVLNGEKHDYIILPPHEKSVIAEVCPAFGVTVRWK